MADTSTLAGFKEFTAHQLGKIKDLPNKFSDAMNVKFMKLGLREIAFKASPELHFLNTEETLNLTAQKVNLPDEYLYHNPKARLVCTRAGETEFIEQIDSPEEFQLSQTSLDDRNYFRIINRQIVVNHANITSIDFPFIKSPTVPNTTPITNELNETLYDSLVWFVIGNYFLSEMSSEEQKQRAYFYFNRFYMEIGALNPTMEAEQKVQ